MLFPTTARKGFLLFYTKNIFTNEDVHKLADIIRNLMESKITKEKWMILPKEYIEKVEFITLDDSVSKMWLLLEKIKGNIPFEVNLDE